MNIKTIFFSFFLVYSTVNCQSQDYSIQWGKESETKNGLLPNKILGEFNGELYVLKEKWSNERVHREISLEKYSSDDMRLLFSTEISKMPGIAKGNTARNNEYFFSNIFLVKGKLILITKDFDAFYATEIGGKGEVIKKSTLIFQEEHYPGVHSGEIGIYSVNTPGFVLSADSTQLIAYSGRIINGTIQIKIINSDLSIATESYIKVDIKNNNILCDFKLDNKNVLYCIAKEELPKSEWISKNIKKYANKIVALDIKNQTFKSKLIPVKINQPLTSFYLECRNETIQVISYYYNGVKHKVSNAGIIYYQFKSSNLELLNNFEMDFDKAIFLQLNSNIDLPGSNSFDDTTNSINSLKGIKIITLKNGDNLIISEQVVSLDKPTTRGLDYFNILVIRVNKNGEFVKSLVIPKFQAGLMKSIYSFESFSRNNALYLVFLDNPKNLNLSDQYKLEGGIAAVRGTVPVIVCITEKGEWSKKALYEGESMPTIYPTISTFRTGNQLIIYGQEGKKIKFAKINY